MTGGIHPRNVRVIKLYSRDPSRSLGGVCVKGKGGALESHPCPCFKLNLPFVLHFGLEEKKKKVLKTSNLIQPSHFTNKHEELKRRQLVCPGQSGLCLMIHCHFV